MSMIPLPLILIVGGAANVYLVRQAVRIYKALPHANGSGTKHINVKPRRSK